MGIMDRLFGNQPQNQQATQQQQQQHQQQQQQNPHVANNPTVPNANTTPPGEFGPDGKPIQNQSSPNDGFKSLWQNDPNSKAPNANAPLININQAELAKNVQRMDFSKQIDPNLFQAVLGDDKAAAANALMQIVNSVGQQSVAQGLIGNSMITENAVKEYGSSLRKEIPSFIKQQSVADGMKQLNPALSDPAYSPLVGAVQQQIQVKYPQATPSELQQMVSDYFDNFATAIGKPAADKQQQQQQAANKDTDWMEYAGGGSTSLDSM